jgi:transposase
MSRYRLLPAPAQEAVLRDFAQAMTAFFDPQNPAGRPSWRKAGRDEGFRIVGRRGRQWDVRRVSRRIGQVRVPKAGWVRFRWSRAVPPGVKSYRVTMDRAGRWHVAFAVIPEPVPAPGNGVAVGIDRRKDWAEKTSTDIARRFDVIRVEDLRIGTMTRSARGTQDNPGRNVRQKAGLNRGILRSGWACWCAAWRRRRPAGWRRSSPRSRASGARRAGRWTGSRVRAKPSSSALPAVSPATLT